MKTKLSILVLLLAFMSQIGVQAQSLASPGIVSGKSFHSEDLTNDFFNRKEKRYDKARNERLREQNQRLERRIEGLERELDDCSASRTRARYPKRRYTSRYDLIQNYWGEKRIEKEYEELKKENVFLRDYHDWLTDELDDCQRSFERGRSRDDYRRPNHGRDRDYRDRDDRNYESCSCGHHHKHYDKHHHKKPKHPHHKNGHKKKRYSCDD